MAITDRRIVLFDPVGTGPQSTPMPASLAQVKGGTLASPAGLALQTDAVTSGTKLQGTKHHVFAHGTGAGAALLYAAGRSDIASITFASPLLAALPEPDAARAAGIKFPAATEPAITKKGLQPVLCLR